MDVPPSPNPEFSGHASVGSTFYKVGVGLRVMQIANDAHVLGILRVRK